MATESTSKPLKHLEFVHTYAHKIAGGASYVEGGYQKVKSYVPAAVQPYVAKAEETCLAYAAPLAAKATDQAEKVLHSTDAQLDALYATSASWLSSSQKLADSNIAAFKGAADKYYDLVKAAAAHVSSKLPTDLSVAKARELLAASLEQAKALADPDAAVAAALDAWAKFTAIPAVAKVLSAASPLTGKGVAAFTAAHDVLVHSALYRYGLSVGASTVAWATSTTPYKLSATYLYPLVQPVADPALDKVSKSTYVNAAIKYWAPVAAA
ncbi:hypothetical protein HYH02_010978 [Chlamydomonas schloesseri]|uniref:Uncharacterized protein n=1 Tax=Chlamydomonas schloesseri TaxID=2026947 RepID=A0A835W3T5_9CHLO|nr:hypothetical protein HYH02_010978 [Chlamydomonas schloesseri]|eukprot:KAG2438280.1 hypothetical protein HYH02_010978 [Chlamydomonas schloesseri]